MCLQPDPGRRSTFADIAVALERRKSEIAEGLESESSTNGERSVVVGAGNNPRAGLRDSIAGTDLGSVSVVVDSEP